MGLPGCLFVCHLILLLMCFLFNSYITWPYQIADNHCRITLVYNKVTYLILLNLQCSQISGEKKNFFKEIIAIPLKTM